MSKSSKRGKRTSQRDQAEVLGISPFAVWLLVNDREYMLSFAEYPWFRSARVEDVYRVELSHGKHLYWPNLDVDLSLDVLANPAAFPLIATTKAKARSKARVATNA